jgi:uncharacterized membrane protein SpoIIM required for sporulation
LEELLGRAQHGLKKLNGAELQELGLLYRQTASDLSTVREDSSGTQFATYLNHLLGRSHNLLYTGDRRGRGGLLDFYRYEYPRVFRETLPLTALATAVFVLSALAGWVVAAHDPGFPHRLLGPQMMDTIEQRKMWTESVVALKPVASSVITTNNLSVAFSIFALGLTGIGTLGMVTFNGLLLGVLAEATSHARMAVAFWSFVAPHGVLELPAILIAGGAGLELSRSLFFPGLLPRRESLSRAGKRAVRLLMGTIPLLLIAGAIEGFFSPTHVPAALKFTLAAALFLALTVYLFQTTTANYGLSLRDTHLPAKK